MCGDGYSDLGPLGSELLLRPFLFLECLSTEASGCSPGSVFGAVAEEERGHRYPLGLLRDPLWSHLGRKGLM